jgi:isopenicillin-N epimerase
VLSWGRIPPARIESWSDEFVWSGTRNPVAYLALPAAIEFLENVGLDAFRARTHWLAGYARQKLTALLGLEPLVPASSKWYGSMALVPLPRARNERNHGDRTDEGCPVSNPLQHKLWHEHAIEAPVIDFRGRRYVRVSCHLYNDTSEIDRLVIGLQTLLARGE